MPEIGPEIPRVEEIVGEDEGHHHDRWGRLIPIATVLTTLIAALVAFAQAGSLNLHDRSDARAENLGALALSAASRDRGAAEVQVDRFNLLTRELRTSATASLFDQYGNSTKASRLEPARWNAVAAQTQTDTVAIANSLGIAYICAPSLQPHCSATNAAYSPEQDPSFPNRYMQQSQWSSYRLTALRDAANQQADDAESQSVHYAAALTMLAVAVFLFGYSLTPQGKARRRLYTTVASGFVLVAGGWALVQALSPVERAPDAAATAFANGRVAAGERDSESAIADFKRAIALRPEFVDAHQQLAEAEYSAGIPHTGTGITTLPTTAGPVTVPGQETLDRAVEADKRAQEAGSDSATVLSELGRYLLYRGVLEHHASDLRESRADLLKAIEKFRRQEHSAGLVALSLLRIAEDDLVLGSSQTDGEYLRAEAELRRGGFGEESTIAAALTELGLIDTSHPSLASRTAGLKQQLIAVGEQGTLTPAGNTAAPAGRPAVTLSGISAQPDPGHALYTISKPGAFDPSKDVLSVQWQYRDPLHGEWAVLPELSGPVQPGGLSGDHSGYASNNPSYVSASAPATCLPSGQYRADLYVNGRLAGSATAKGNWPTLRAVRFSDVDGAICVPAGWTPLPDAQPGAEGYAAPDHSSGVFILSIPQPAAAALGASRHDLADLMTTIVKSFAFLFPGVAPNDRPHSTPFFMSSDNGQLRQWTYRKGFVLTGVGTSSNGQIYVGMTWGPDSNVTSQLFLSLSPL